MLMIGTSNTSANTTAKAVQVKLDAQRKPKRPPDQRSLSNDLIIGYQPPTSTVSGGSASGVACELAKFREDL